MINSKNDNITQKNTYGWHRVEVVGAMSALVFLASLSFGTAIEALQVINSLWKWDFFIVGTAIYYNVSKKMILLLWAWPTFVASKLLSNRQTFPVEGHGLKRLFHNGRRKTPILIGLFLVTSSDSNYSARPISWRPLWNWACFSFERNQYILEVW